MFSWVSFCSSPSMKVMLEMSTPNRAGLLLPQAGDENEDVLMLVMPVMLNSYA